MAPLHPHLDGSLTLAVTVAPGMLLTGVWSLLPWDRGEASATCCPIPALGAPVRSAVLKHFASGGEGVPGGRHEAPAWSPHECCTSSDPLVEWLILVPGQSS